MKKFFPFFIVFFCSLSVFSETQLFFDDFESGVGSWKFSTKTGGNDFKIFEAVGTNASYGVRCEAIGDPNYMISPVVNFDATSAY